MLIERGIARNGSLLDREILVHISFFFSRRKMGIPRWSLTKSIVSNDLSSSPIDETNEYTKTVAILPESFHGSFSLDSFVEITSRPRPIHRQRGVCRFYLPDFSSFSLYPNNLSRSYAETACRFHQILPVMSAASITRHYPSISRSPRSVDESKGRIRVPTRRIGHRALLFFFLSLSSSSLIPYTSSPGKRAFRHVNTCVLFITFNF